MTKDEDKDKKITINIEGIGDLTKPLTVLVEKSATGLSNMFAKTIAQNLVDAQAIREQNNMTNTVKIAADNLPPETDLENTQNIDEDLIAYLLKNCSTVADQKMQQYWGKLLAEEMKKNNSVSKKTISILSTMSKKDMEMFTDFCQFVWNVGVPKPLIYKYDDAIYNTQDYMFNILDHIRNIGLISFDLSSSYGALYKKNRIYFSYHDVKVLVEVPVVEKEFSMNAGQVLLTQAGIELYSICGAKKNDEFLDYVMKIWTELGYKPRRCSK